MKKQHTFHRFLMASIADTGWLPEIPSNVWVGPLHLFRSTPPVKRRAGTRFEYLIAEIYSAPGAPVSTGWYTASRSDAQLAAEIVEELAATFGASRSVKVTSINRAPASRPEFEKYTHWINALP